MDLIPVYGTTTSTIDVLSEYDAGHISMSEAIFEMTAIGAFAGVVFGLTFVHAPSVGTVKAAVALSPKLPAVGAVAALAVATHLVTQRSVDVEHGPYGTVRVTPRLGFF